MLSLDRPLGVVAGLALFGDHADGARVYYAVTRPRLARTGAEPELVLVKFKDQNGSGGAGLLSFTAELVASEHELEQASQHLVRQGITEPRLVQVPWVSGKAFLASALAQGDGFVERMLGEVTPDTIAGNRAMFSLRLNDQGTRLIEDLLDSRTLGPIGVRYELAYHGLRPALDVRVRADYERIYRELSWGLQIGVAYEGIGVRAAVESATRKLRQTGGIEIEVLQFDDDEQLRVRIDTAVRWLSDRILQDMFATSLQPPAHENLLQRAIEAAIGLGAATLQQALQDTALADQIAQQLGVSPQALAGLGQSAQSGSAASSSTFALQLQFSLRDIDQRELKTFSYDWREAKAERRVAAPQGLLSRMGGRARVIESTTDQFWSRLDVDVRALGDFTALGVQRMIVQLAHPDERLPDTQSALTFEPGDQEPKRFSCWTNGKGPRYRARAEVHFDERGPWPGPAQFVGEWQTSQSLQLAVHPLGEAPKLELEIAPGTLDFSEVSQVQLELMLGEEAIATRMLTATKPNETLRLRLQASRGAARPLSARATWFLAGGGRVTGDWFPVEGTALLVPGPWQSTRSVRVLPMLPHTFLQALVTLSLTEGGRSRSVELQLEPGDRRARTVSIPSLSPEASAMQVDVLVVRDDGSVYTSVFETRDPVVMVRDRDGDFRRVGVRLLAGAGLSLHGLMALQVQLLGREGETLDGVVFTESQREPSALLVPIGDDGGAAHYRVIRYALDGSATYGPVLEVGSELLVPALAPP